MRGRGGDRERETLALISVPRPTALSVQTGGHSTAKRRVKFFYKGKQKKTEFQLVRPGAQLSIISEPNRAKIYIKLSKSRKKVKNKDSIKRYFKF